MVRGNILYFNEINTQGKNIQKKVSDDTEFKLHMDGNVYIASITFYAN